MYSNNDYRDYLEHRKWSWPNGNNSKEYNHWYYENHPEKWKKGAKDLLDILKADEELYQDQLKNKEIKKEYESAKKNLINVQSSTQNKRKEVKDAQLYNANKRFKDASDALTNSNNSIKQRRKILKELETRYGNTIIGKFTRVAEQIGRKVLETLKKLR